MSAKIDAKFSRGFFLSEEALTKIENVVQQRLSQGANYIHKFDAHRVDDAVTTYNKAADLISSEENSKRNAIKGLDFEAVSDTGKVSLSFARADKTKLVIESPDRDLALLLSADLKEYLKSEVLVKRFAFISGLIENKATFPLLMTITLIPMLVAIAWTDRPEVINLSKASVDEKLDYLVNIGNARLGLENGFPAYIVLFPFIVIIMLFILSSSIVYPAYTFYWGKEISRYDSARSVRGKIFWVVVVGLVISLIGAYLSRGF